MDYLTVPTLPSVPQMEKSAPKEETVPVSNLGGPGPSLGQASAMSLMMPPSQEPSTIMAATSVIMPSQARSKEFRRHSRSPRSRRGSKGTHSSIRGKGGSKPVRYRAKRKRRRRHMNLKVLIYRYWNRARPYLVSLRKIIYDLTQSVFFDVFICTVVAINITMLVAQTFAKIEIRGEWFFSAMDPAFLSVYVVEAILKIIALDFEYFHDPWNNIDFFIMIMTVLDFVLPLFISSRQGNRDNTVALFRVLKICKGIRAIRAIRFLLTLRIMENLQEITSTFILSSQSIGAIILLMFSFLFMSSVVLRDMFHEEDAKHFGDLFKTIFTLFQLFTLDDWSVIYITCYDAGAWYIIIFLIIYILVEYFLLLNLVIAVLVDNFQMALLKRHELKKQKIYGQCLSDLDHRVAPEDLEIPREVSSQKVIKVEGFTAEDDHSAKMTEIPQIKEEHEEEFFRRTLMGKYGSLELMDSEWQLLYSYFQLMTAIETNQQQFRSQASTTDKILDTFFETAEDDYIPK